MIYRKWRLLCYTKHQPTTVRNFLFVFLCLWFTNTNAILRRWNVHLAHSCWCGSSYCITFDSFPLFTVECWATPTSERWKESLISFYHFKQAFWRISAFLSGQLYIILIVPLVIVEGTMIKMYDNECIVSLIFFLAIKLVYYYEFTWRK